MSHKYDPTKPDPLGIRAETESERLKSRFRDSRTRERIHPIDYDIHKLLDFILERRRRAKPHDAVWDAALRVLETVDTQALRFLVSTIFDKGRVDHVTRRRCRRVLGYCDTVNKAYAVTRALRGEAFNDK